MLANTRKASTMCTGSAVADMALAAVETTVNDTKYLDIDVDIQIVGCHDPSILVHLVCNS